MATRYFDTTITVEFEGVEHKADLHVTELDGKYTFTGVGIGSGVTFDSVKSLLDPGSYEDIARGDFLNALRKNKEAK